MDTVISYHIRKNLLNFLNREGFFRLSVRTLLVGTAEFSPLMGNQAFFDVYFASTSYYFRPSIGLESIVCSG